MNIPMNVSPAPISGLGHGTVGKVRQRYSLAGVGHPGLQLVIASDRLSVHDVILPVHVRGKGVVLNLLDLWWRKTALQGFRHDVVAAGAGIDAYLPPSLRGNPDWHRRARITEIWDMISAELIVRGELTGSAWKAYQKSCEYCGQKLPEGMHEWDPLNPSLFTPTSKESDGHDEPIDCGEFEKIFGQEPRSMALKAFATARSIVRGHGFILIDTKFEMGRPCRMDQAELGFADEVLTPDSSRYLRIADLDDAKRTRSRPPSFDKQKIRDWVTEHLGVGPSTELTPETVARVHSAEIPSELTDEMSVRYLEFFRELTGMSTGEFVKTL